MEELKKSKFQASSHHPQIVVLVIDDSGSMSLENKMLDVHSALEDAILELSVGNANASYYRFLVSVVSFGMDGKIIAGPTAPTNLDPDEIKRNLPASDGSTNLAAGLREARRAVEASLAELRGKSYIKAEICPGPLVLVLTDGIYTGEEPFTEADKLKAIKTDSEPVFLAVGGVGLPVEAEKAMERIASETKYFFTLNPTEIRTFFAQAMATLLGPADSLVLPPPPTI